MRHKVFDVQKNEWKVGMYMPVYRVEWEVRFLRAIYHDQFVAKDADEAREKFWATPSEGSIRKIRNVTLLSHEDPDEKEED